VDYVDIWSHHTPYPFNQLPKTYSFMVRNSLIWRVGYYGQQPRFIHVPTQTVSSLFVSRQVGAAFDHYKPDLVVSVHPLMQLVPLRVLRQQARCCGSSLQYSDLVHAALQAAPAECLTSWSGQGFIQHVPVRGAGSATWRRCPSPRSSPT
jgi:hypothetical protein